MVSLNPGQFNGTTIRNKLQTLLPSYTDHQNIVPESKTNRKLQTWTLINRNHYLVNILQIVFLESVFLVLIDEENIGEKRSPAKMTVLTCQRIQAINLKKKHLGLIRKMRNAIKLFLYYYKQNNLLCQHFNDCLLGTLSEWLPQRTHHGETHSVHIEPLCLSSPSSDSLCHIWVLSPHYSSPSWEYVIFHLMCRENM